MVPEIAGVKPKIVSDKMLLTVYTVWFVHPSAAEPFKQTVSPINKFFVSLS